MNNYNITNISPLSANPIKWSNTLKQFFDNLTTNCLSAFDHFVILTFKGLVFNMITINTLQHISVNFSTYLHVIFAFFLKDKLLFHVLHCFCMFVNRHFACLEYA